MDVRVTIDDNLVLRRLNTETKERDQEIIQLPCYDLQLVPNLKYYMQPLSYYHRPNLFKMKVAAIVEEKNTNQIIAVSSLGVAKVYLEGKPIFISHGIDGRVPENYRNKKIMSKIVYNFHLLLPEMQFSYNLQDNNNESQLKNDKSLDKIKADGNYEGGALTATFASAAYTTLPSLKIIHSSVNGIPYTNYFTDRLFMQKHSLFNPAVICIAKADLPSFFQQKFGKEELYLVNIGEVLDSPLFCNYFFLKEGTKEVGLALWRSHLIYRVSEVNTYDEYQFPPPEENFNGYFTAFGIYSHDFALGPDDGFVVSSDLPDPCYSLFLSLLRHVYYFILNDIFVHPSGIVGEKQNFFVARVVSGSKEEKYFDNWDLKGNAIATLALYSERTNYNFNNKKVFLDPRSFGNFIIPSTLTAPIANY